jgi:prepilin-type processing-associated H-X9-DG protein
MMPVVFTCPYDDVFHYLPETGDWQNRSNFTSIAINLGYSFADGYPDAASKGAGYQWTTRLGATFAIAADKNPGTDAPRDDVLDVIPGASSKVTERGNSNNHEQDGQNVLFGDGHVEWTKTCLCGTNGDNIYANQNNHLDQSPVNGTDSLLLPTDDN